MEFFMELNSKLNSIVWGPPFLILIVGTGYCSHSALILCQLLNWATS